MSGAEQWEATIERAGRWTWEVHFTKGLMGFRYPDIVFGGEERAKRVACRKLAKLRRNDQRRAESRVTI